MIRATVVFPLVLALACLATSASAEEDERRNERFYIGGYAGYEYFDMDALSGGEVFDQALDDATRDFNINSPTTVPDIDQPEPRSYTASNAFVWGLYAGFSLGNYVRLGARMTHSAMEVTPEYPAGEQPEGDVTFNMDLLTIVGEFQLRIPISFVVPFAGIGAGYAYLRTDGQITAHGEGETFEGYVNALDVQASVGLDFNLGSYFSIGAVAHFSFIGFYYSDPDDPAQTEAAWGFVNDYMLRATIRI